MRYRPEVDGLRAIAVLSVILYHAKVSVANWQILPGGFLGVDIFFVISGYLITTLLMNELAQNQRISLLGFYGRRARRLLPALTLVMLVSIPVAQQLLLPAHLLDLCRSIILSVFFASNLYWDFSLQQYGAESSLLRPFLHTWSLAVEEQYYIVFPLLLFALYRWGRRYLPFLLSIGFVVSLLYAQNMSGADPTSAFYMLPSRFWELLAGSLLALLLIKRGNLDWSPVLRATMPAVGLVLVVGSLCFFDLQMRHPGFLTLIPVLGTVLVICFGGGRDLVTRALTRPLMVYIGLISYALYLWHYPIFAFGRIESSTPSHIEKVIWVFLTFACSIASYHLLEKPLRSRTVSSKTFFAIMFPAIGAVLLMSVYWLVQGDGKPPASDYLQSLIYESRSKPVLQGNRNCHSTDSGSSLSDACVFEFAPNAPTLVLIGDSHASTLAWPLHELAKENGYSYAQITQAGCSHILGLSKGPCQMRSEAVSAFVQGLSSPTIIFSSRLPLYLELERFDNQEGWQETGYKAADPKIVAAVRASTAKKVISTLSAWREDAQKLVIIYPVPEQGFHVYNMLNGHETEIKKADDLPTLSTSYKVFKQRVASSYSVLDQVAGSKVSRIYPEKVFCRDESGRCIASAGEQLYFGFDNHLADIGAILVTTEIAEALSLELPESIKKESAASGVLENE